MAKSLKKKLSEGMRPAPVVEKSLKQRLAEKPKYPTTVPMSTKAPIPENTAKPKMRINVTRAYTPVGVTPRYPSGSGAVDTVARPKMALSYKEITVPHDWQSKKKKP